MVYRGTKPARQLRCGDLLLAGCEAVSLLSLSAQLLQCCMFPMRYFIKLCSEEWEERISVQVSCA